MMINDETVFPSQVKFQKYVPLQLDSEVTWLPCVGFHNTPFVAFQFPPSAETSLFSNSVVDVFTQLTQCFGVVSKLECPDPEIWKRFMKRFAKTIVKVLLAYADICKKEFPNYVDDEKKVRMATYVFMVIPWLPFFLYI